jgi:protein O-GlcNAc transferase
MKRAALQSKLDAAIRHHRQNELEQAERLYRLVLAKDDRHPVALHLLGAMLLQQGRNDEALRILRQGVARAPGQAILFANLGEAYRRLGDHGSAKTSLQRAIALEPGLAEAHYNLALTLQSIGHQDDAVVYFRSAISLKPNLPTTAYAKLATALRELEQIDESLSVWIRAVELDPNSAEAHAGVGNLLLEQGRIDEALASLRRGLELNAGDQALHSRIVSVLGLHPDSDSGAILAEAIRWRERHAGAFVDGRRLHANERDPDRRLRLGYLSPDLRHHTHAFFLLPLFRNHDRRAVEVFAYSLTDRPDEFTERIRATVDEFRDVSRLDDRDLIESIRRDAIDVLVDVSMHLNGNRLRALAARPAPVQVVWLAYPGTTGLDGIDYRMTDVFLDPPDASVDARYSERSLRLPETFWCYDPLAREVAVNPLPALRRGRITFGCLSRSMTRNGEVYALWSRVLRAVDGSRMILFAWPGESRRRTREAFAREGVAPERIDFVELQARDEYFRAYHEIDIGLDTVPHNGGATSLDSYWMGVPVITLVGRTVAGRAGLTFASNLGLPELACDTPERFVEAALRLSGDVARLAGLRDELRQRMERSPLMDGPRFARNFESAVRSAWRSWCEADLGPSLPAQRDAGASQGIRPMLRIVCATRLGREEFGQRTLLGRCGQLFRTRGDVVFDVAFANASGLPDVYNAAIERAADDDALAFVHDDVFIDDWAQLSEKVNEALARFAVVGVAGNRRRVPNQAAWAFLDEQGTWDAPHNLSGEVGHVGSGVSRYGPTPSPVKLLDGVLLITRASVLRASGVRFDPRFMFHFYDLDFCRSCEKAGVALGTWPIAITHASGGSFGSDAWRSGVKAYRAKWGD